MSFKLISYDLDGIENIAKEILERTSPDKKFVFYANMGVGKTTLIKALSLQLDVVDIVSSPTFSIVNEYMTKKNGKIYHFDFYRLNEEQEAFDIGYEEYLSEENYCFIEWPEKIPNLIQEDMIKIKMYLDGNKRIIEVI